MESLNLNTLVSSLPAAQQNAEKELSNNFKAAALSITTLYRSSRRSAKRAYNAGYASACEDMLNFLQQGVSAGSLGPAVAGPSRDVDGGGMTIGRVMDWTEARLDAIKALEEDEDEDEEREKEKDRPRSAAPSSSVSKPDGKKLTATPSNAVVQSSKPSTSRLPPPSSPVPQVNVQLPHEPSSPSPPPPIALRPNCSRPSKARTPVKGDQMIPFVTQSSNIPSSTLNFPSEPLNPASENSAPFPETSIVIGAGAKRRHAMMMMLDSTSPIVPINGSTSASSSPATGGGFGGNNVNHSAPAILNRRRTRSSRNLAHATQPLNHNFNMIQAPSEAMDIEDDGRERKRVARR